ncbi:hypothetical protein [Solirubrum puertoriconensis]|uniref:Uncharacterized protein n=1 Tax=Solirubrum puertoriconensis TaxID=1751427 RepID=A0A9X0HJ55_SOLP1|nr:hypothetical protein [Solirubrum puertoriconensis]KUG06880.1 hypothetical protein ASU33_06025 [Solirubrum puertoriconensis]
MAIAYTEELLAQAEAWASLPLEERRSAAGLLQLAVLYSYITGEPAGSCRQCQYSDYNQVVQAYIRQATRHLHPETMADSNYTLANGYESEQFVHEDYNKVVTADNLTDEDAEFFIGKGFEHAFVKKASAAEATEAESTGETEGEEEEPAKKPTEKERLLATYKQLHGEEADASLTIPQLKEANAAKQADLDAQRD